MRCTPNPSAETGAVPPKEEEEAEAAAPLPSQHRPLALLSPAAEPPPPAISGLFWGEHSPALSFSATLLGKAPRAMFHVSGGALAEPVLTEAGSSVAMGFEAGCTGAALSSNGKILHL